MTPTPSSSCIKDLLWLVDSDFFPTVVPPEEMYGEFADKVLEYVKMEFPCLEIVSDPSFPRSLWLQNHPDGTPHSDGKARIIEI